MPQGKIILDIKSAAKLADDSGGATITLPDGSLVPSGGAVDSEGNQHTICIYQLTTCEDNGSGTLENYTRLFLCSDRFKLPGQ
jgi:hypothetical protein